MKFFINKHQLYQIVNYIKKNYITFTQTELDNKFSYGPLDDLDFPIPTKKADISFKKIIWPNGQQINPKGTAVPARKMAFLGLPNCDAIALETFLKEFKNTDLVPKRGDVLIVSVQCLPDEFCFCTALGNDKITTFDLHIQKERNGYSIFSGTKSGENILSEAGLDSRSGKPFLNTIILSEKEDLNKSKLSKAINDSSSHLDFWQKISDNCFGCGSCSAVCPLCFCIHKEAINDLDSSSNENNPAICLHWDACFSKSFSEIQNHVDLRDKRAKRLYNWYHHKFVRSFAKDKDFLCTGCGRCIKACPANLNQYRIISSVEKQEEKK